MIIPNNVLAATISRGSILHSNTFVGIDHGKFFVIIGEDDEHVAGFFYINSNVHPLLDNKPEQFAMQYIIRPGDYKFLHHDSFINASSIQKIAKSELIDSISCNETQIIDSLKPPHLEELLDLLRESPLYSPSVKRTYFY